MKSRFEDALFRMLQISGKKITPDMTDAEEEFHIMEFESAQQELIDALVDELVHPLWIP
jgi:hypothetical protein